MIARLTGTLAEAGTDAAVIDVGGVGYLVQASTRTLSVLGTSGGTVAVFVETQVREDAITLFGFGSVGERDWFRLLTSVQGVGGRVALAILSVLGPVELANAIGAGDKAAIARAQGVGPKLAQRIANELKEKAGALPAPPGTTARAASGGLAEDAVSALANLGFRPGEANAAVAAAEAELGPAASLDALVRVALRRAAR